MRRKGGKPNFIIILIDDLRFDEVGICGHPYMKTPHIDRIGREGTRFVNAFHTTPLCSPNRASIVTGQYASRHGIIDNVARDAHSHRLPNYHATLQELGYETAHIGKWHMGNSADPRPGYDTWVSFPGHGAILDPVLNENGQETKYRGYITDLLNERAVAFLRRPRARPFALFLAHKAVHPDAYQAADGTIDFSRGGYLPAGRHRDLYKGERFPRRRNARPPEEVVRAKPAFREAFELKRSEKARALLDGIQAGTDEEIRLRAAMMASVDEGVGDIFAALEDTGQLDNTMILFLGDNGYFFGEHGLGPERRFAYEEGIRSPFLVRYPPLFDAGQLRSELVLALDIAPTVVDLAGGAARHRLTCRAVPCAIWFGRRGDAGPAWRDAFLCEYFSDNAMPWLIGMSYKAVRTRRYKYIHWTQRSLDGLACDELYDLGADPYEMTNLIGHRAHAPTVIRMRRLLGRLVAQAVGL